MVTVIPRSEWGARYADGGGRAPVPFTEWWLHHSAGSAPDLVPPYDDEYAAMRTLEDIGQQRFGQGISYTWPVMPTGRIYQGHSVDRLGAHTGGRNSAARAICFVGNYDVQQVTPAQVEAAAQLMVQEYRAGRAKRYTLNGGHRQLKATACPGNNGFAAIPAINARAIALMAGAAPINPEDDFMDAEARREFGELRRLAALAVGVQIAPRAPAEKTPAEQMAAVLAPLQAAVNALSTVLAAGRSDVTAEEIRSVVREEMANTVQVEVSVRDSPPAGA